MMLRKIRVYGKLASFLGQRTFEAAVDSAAEAVRFLAVNFPGLELHMADKHYRVSVGTYDLGKDELADPVGQQAIKIMPVISGAGGGTGKILAGVALIAAAIVLGPASGGFFGLGMGLSGAGMGIIGGAAAVGLGTLGLGLALTGTAQLLSPTPRLSGPGTAASNREVDPRESFSFSGIQNTSRQGLPVPIVYGETIVGSVVISAGIDTVRVRG